MTSSHSDTRILYSYLPSLLQSSAPLAESTGLYWWLHSQVKPWFRAHLRQRGHACVCVYIYIHTHAYRLTCVSIFVVFTDCCMCMCIIYIYTYTIYIYTHVQTVTHTAKEGDPSGRVSACFDMPPVDLNSSKQDQLRIYMGVSET